MPPTGESSAMLPTGSVVESNVIGGNQINVPDGAPVIMSFQVDSTNFLNSPSFPTRGYPINLSSFAMTAGGQPINITNPQVSGTAYFVLRNNDPAVDGICRQNAGTPAIGGGSGNTSGQLS